MAAQRPTITPMTLTTLQKKCWIPWYHGNIDTHKGCKLLTPNLEAMAPVMKGRSAEPVWPRPAIQPTAPERSQCGIRRAVLFMTIGYIGPKTRPMRETATAFPISDGTHQIVISNLWNMPNWKKSSKAREGDVPNRYENIKPHNASFSNLQIDCQELSMTWHMDITLFGSTTREQHVLGRALWIQG